MQKEQITWRSFWNGKDGTGGPISTEWNVHGWPTLYIIDHKGVIRHKYLGSPGDDRRRHSTVTAPTRLSGLIKGLLCRPRPLPG